MMTSALAAAGATSAQVAVGAVTRSLDQAAAAPEPADVALDADPRLLAAVLDAELAVDVDGASGEARVDEDLEEAPAEGGVVGGVVVAPGGATGRAVEGGVV